MANAFLKLAFHSIRARIKNKPYKLNFTVTSFCNSKCLTCNIWQNPITKDEFTIAEIEQTFKKLPDTICWLSLTGGEPFSRADFGEIMKTAIKHIPNLAVIGIPTNGLYQPRILAIAQEIMSIPNHPKIIISFSIDGPEEIHDVVRGVKGGFQKTWDTYTKLKTLTQSDKNFVVAIETTISTKNIDGAHPFLEKLLLEGHHVSLTFAHEAYLYRNNAGEIPTGIVPTNIDKIESLISLFNKKFRFWHPQDIIEKNYLNAVPNFLRNRTKKVVPCMSLITTISIDAFGNATPCLMWGKKLGGLRENSYDLSAIYNSTISDETRKEIHDDKCPNCWTPCEAYQSVLWNKIRIKK